MEEVGATHSTVGNWISHPAPQMCSAWTPTRVVHPSVRVGRT